MQTQHAQAKEIALYVAKHGYDINIHAIGDATTHLAIEMLQAIWDAGYADTRFVVSHSQSWLPEDIKRAGKLGAFINSTGVWHDVTTQEYEESVESFIINNAWEIRMEDKLGSIEVGKLTDLVVIDKNLFDIPTTEIHNVKVVETIKDGITTYKA